jgi:lauroyl/myristoyl acyltransferase
MWENLGRTFAESFRIKTLTESDRIVFEPAEGFDEAGRGAKPFIVCGLHLGNWEILAHGGQRLGVSLIGVYQRISKEQGTRTKAAAPQIVKESSASPRGRAGRPPLPAYRH